MIERIGRNDLCHCGSKKKYKNCCLQKEQQAKKPLGRRKFTAKVLSAGGAHAPQTQMKEEQQQTNSPADYTALMERSFGQALHSYEDKPPLPSNPSEYLIQEETSDSLKL